MGQPCRWQRDHVWRDERQLFTPNCDQDLDFLRPK